MFPESNSPRIEMFVRALALLLVFTLLEEAGAPRSSSETSLSSCPLQETRFGGHRPLAMNGTKVLVKVRVMDEKTAPLVNVTVRLTQNGSLPGIAATGITNQDGYVAFYVPSTAYRVEVQRNSVFEKPFVKVVTVSSNTSVVLKLKSQGDEHPTLSTAALLGILLSALVITWAGRFTLHSENRSKETASERFRES